MNARIRLLADIYIVMCGGCMGIGIALCLWLFVSRDPSSGKALEFIGTGFAAFSVAYFIPGLAGGFGLLYGRHWARVVIITLSVLGIFVFPIGTALGGFGLWVLLGPDSKQLTQLAAAQRPQGFPFRAPTLSPADRKRYVEVLLVAVGIGTGFVVMIGTGYHVTHTDGSPISDLTYFMAIGVFVLVGVALVWRIFPGAMSGVASEERKASRNEQRKWAEDRRRGEEERRRRLETLAADPIRRKYAERIQRGESWSDEQIEYDLNADALATCAHLQPIEREMRAAAIDARLKLPLKITARCSVDAESLGARFVLPPFVAYTEPEPNGMDFENPLPAVIACAEHTSSIDVVHPLDTTADTPRFPSTAGAQKLDGSPRVDRPHDRFTELRSRILALARIIDAPSQVIPTYRHSAQTGLPHIEIDGETYHYVHEDRGQEFERFSTTSLDELLYRIFRDVAWSMSSNLARPYQKPGDDFRREMFKQQLVLLGRLNPEWMSRCAAEHRETLVEYPFVDKR